MPERKNKQGIKGALQNYNLMIEIAAVVQRTPSQ